VISREIVVTDPSKFWNVLDKITLGIRVIYVLRPDAFARAVGIACSREIRPGVHEFVGKFLLLRTEIVADALVAAMKAREEVLKVRCVLGERREIRQFGKHEWRRAVAEFIGV
jgi:hypothetical protein